MRNLYVNAEQFLGGRDALYSNSYFATKDEKEDTAQ